MKPMNVKNVKVKFQIDQYMELNPFFGIEGTSNLLFMIYEFHDFFDGLIGYEPSSLLNAAISTNSNTFHLPFANIVMQKRFPETTMFQLHVNETKLIELPFFCQKEGEYKYPIPNITEVLDKLGRCNYLRHWI